MSPSLAPSLIALAALNSAADRYSTSDVFIIRRKSSPSHAPTESPTSSRVVGSSVGGGGDSRGSSSVGGGVGGGASDWSPIKPDRPGSLGSSPNSIEDYQTTRIGSDSSVSISSASLSSNLSPKSSNASPICRHRSLSINTSKLSLAHEGDGSIGTPSPPPLSARNIMGNKPSTWNAQQPTRFPGSPRSPRAMRSPLTPSSPRLGPILQSMVVGVGEEEGGNRRSHSQTVP